MHYRRCGHNNWGILVCSGPMEDPQMAEETLRRPQQDSARTKGIGSAYWKKRTAYPAIRISEAAENRGTDGSIFFSGEFF